MTDTTTKDIVFGSAKPISLNDALTTIQLRPDRADGHWQVLKDGTFIIALHVGKTGFQFAPEEAAQIGSLLIVLAAAAINARDGTELHDVAVPA